MKQCEISESARVLGEGRGGGGDRPDRGTVSIQHLPGLHTERQRGSMNAMPLVTSCGHLAEVLPSAIGTRHWIPCRTVLPVGAHPSLKMAICDSERASIASRSITTVSLVGCDTKSTPGPHGVIAMRSPARDRCSPARPVDDDAVQSPRRYKRTSITD